MQNKKEMKRKKLNEMKDAKPKKQSENKQNNILKQNEGKKLLFIFALKQNKIYGSETKQKEK
jgi:hypothetical protein